MSDSKLVGIAHQDVALVLIFTYIFVMYHTVCHSVLHGYVCLYETFVSATWIIWLFVWPSYNTYLFMIQDPFDLVQSEYKVAVPADLVDRLRGCISRLHVDNFMAYLYEFIILELTKDTDPYDDDNDAVDYQTFE